MGMSADDRAQHVPALLAQIDADGDGMITLDEFVAAAHCWFIIAEKTYAMMIDSCPCCC